MKKIILPLAAGVLLFASCKKDFTCSCETTSTVTTLGTSFTETTTTVTTVNDVKNSVVSNKMECYDEEYTETYDIGGDLVTEVTAIDCEIL